MPETSLDGMVVVALNRTTKDGVVSFNRQRMLRPTDDLIGGIKTPKVYCIDDSILEGHKLLYSFQRRNVIIAGLQDGEPTVSKPYGDSYVSFKAVPLEYHDRIREYFSNIGYDKVVFLR